MTFIKRIKPYTSCDESLVWWDFNRGPNKFWFFTLAFYFPFGLLKIQLFKYVKVKVSFAGR